MTFRIGIDLGGTKIELAALDATGDVMLRRRVPSPSHDYGAIIAGIGDLVEGAERDLGARATVGVGTPGAPSLRTGRIRNANSTVLNGQPLRHDLERRLGRPVRLANDANCFALSEATDGAARGAPVVFGVILGTGVGGGLVVHGRLIEGVNAIAGEWGHNPLPAPTREEEPLPECYCGRRGCIETFLSGPGFAAEHGRRHGGTLDAVEIARRARAGDAECEASLVRYEARLARALAGVINIVDPDAIVLGGGLSRLDRLYDNVPKRWGADVFCDEVRTRLLPPVHGDSSGVRGAAWLWAPQEVQGSPGPRDTSGVPRVA